MLPPRVRPVARVLLPVLVSLLSASCSAREPASDTGYEGTWSLGNERVASTLSIVRRDGGYLARLGLRTADGKREIRCGWNGRCDEVFDGARTHAWTIEARVDPGTGRLVFEADARAVSAGGSDYRSVDELVVGPGGRTIEAFTIERNGQLYEEGARPKRVYEKRSDRVEDPPR